MGWQDEYDTTVRSTLRAEVEWLRGDNERLRAALEYVIERIATHERWWMDCPDKGGFDLERLRAALDDEQKG